MCPEILTRGLILAILAISKIQLVVYYRILIG